VWCSISGLGYESSRFYLHQNLVAADKKIQTMLPIAIVEKKNSCNKKILLF